jgi:hypothetical protein
VPKLFRNDFFAGMGVEIFPDCITAILRRVGKRENHWNIDSDVSKIPRIRQNAY